MNNLRPMFTEEAEIHICTNCDAEYSVNLISRDEGYVVMFCPFCGIEFDEQDDYEDEEDE